MKNKTACHLLKDHSNSCNFKSKLYDALMSDTPSVSLSNMLDEILLYIPEIQSCINCGQNRHHEHDVWVHTLLYVDNCPHDLTLRLVGLFHDIAKPITKTWNDKTKDYTFIDHEDLSANMARSIMNRLEIENINIICHLIKNHLIQYENLLTDKALKRWKIKIGDENIYAIYKLAQADILSKGKDLLTDNLAKLDKLYVRANTINNNVIKVEPTLAINGKDIMDIKNIPPGPIVGKILKYLNHLVEKNSDLNTKDKLVDIIKDINLGVLYE